MGRPHTGSATSDLFEPEASRPAGFKYQPEFLALEEERELVAQFADLSLRPFEFQGYVGNRRVVSFGWQYDFNTRQLRKAEDIPGFLTAIRARAADLAGIAPTRLQQVLLTEYAPGAGIGWHRDKAVFGEVVGISLLSACTFRFRRKKGAGWDRASIVAEPRSAYLLQGPSRTEWEHSIPAVDDLRYSITFRNLRAS
jgi:alkylated DNA repair dioxygenase AlkB